MNRPMINKRMERAKETADELGDKARGIVQNAREAAGEWKQKVQGGVESLADTASDYVEQGRRKADALGRTVSGRIHERPVSSLLLAVGVGLPGQRPGDRWVDRDREVVDSITI